VAVFREAPLTARLRIGFRACFGIRISGFGFKRAPAMTWKPALRTLARSPWINLVPQFAQTLEFVKQRAAADSEGLGRFRAIESVFS
jgi:hypothetical protein